MHVHVLVGIDNGANFSVVCVQLKLLLSGNLLARNVFPNVLGVIVF